ncbi:MAG: DnaJ domain-containing protein [Exilispira sp.]|jgi:molecular chaperone DnaJ|nr:DnaJ domain-containing protein [Exilispira sp.]
MGKDPYEILGLSRNASMDEIKARYRELVKKYHPDKHQGNPLADLAEERFKEIQQAYDDIINNRASSSQNYENNYSSSSYTYNVDYENIISLIQNGRYSLANQKLDQINDRNSGLWNYLKSIVCANMGDLQNAMNYIQIAISIEPNNINYQKFRDQLINYNSRPYYSQAQTGSTSSCLDCLTCLCCFNCLCNSCS